MMNEIAVFATPSEQVGWGSTLAYHYRRLARHLLNELEAPAHFHIHQTQGFCLELTSQALAAGHQVTFYRDNVPLIPPQRLEPFAGVQVVRPTSPPRVWVRQLTARMTSTWCLRFPMTRGGHLGGYNGLAGLVPEVCPDARPLWPMLKEV